VVSQVMTITVAVAAVGSALIAGLFFAFSTFVMTALFRLPVDQGVAAMQSINKVILGSLFMPVFFGTAVRNPDVDGRTDSNAQVYSGAIPFARSSSIADSLFAR
jgi:hypothetical protein